MLGRIFCAAAVYRSLACLACLVAMPSIQADEGRVEQTLVLGEQPLDAQLVEPDAVVIEADEGVVMEPLVEEPFVTEGVAGAGCTSPGGGVACVDDDLAWLPYTTIDALFIQRVNTVGPLAVVSPGADDAGATVIAAGDVRYPTSPGIRVFQGWRRSDSTGIELGYLGVWGMHADALAVSPTDDLAVPGELGAIGGSGLESASAIQPTLAATLNSVEVNVFGTRVHSGCRRHDPLPWRRAGFTTTADWLLGIRWAGLDESATLDVTALVNDSPPAFNTTAYRVTTSSQLVGPQVGHRRRLERGPWAFEGWAKVGLMASQSSQSQSAVVGPFDSVVIREPRSSTRLGIGMIGDLNAVVVRRVGDHWGVRAGYSLIWLEGVAPAANQWDFTDTPSSGTRLVPGSVFLHGATFGLEATW
jgi:hypothetical protein